MPMETVTLKKDNGTTFNVHCLTQEEFEKIQAFNLNKLRTACRYQLLARRACIIFVSCVVLVLTAIVLLFVLL